MAIVSGACIQKRARVAHRKSRRSRKPRSSPDFGRKLGTLLAWPGVTSLAHNARVVNQASSGQAATKAASSARPKWIVLFACGVAVSLALAYVLGRAEGRLHAQAEQRRLSELAARNATSIQSLQQKLSAQRSRIYALEARRRIHLAILSLRQHNFGTAQDYAVAASKALKQADRADSAGFAQLVEQLKSFVPNVSDDVAGQEERLIQLARELDRSL